MMEEEEEEEEEEEGRWKRGRSSNQRKGAAMLLGRLAPPPSPFTHINTHIKTHTPQQKNTRLFVCASNSSQIQAPPLFSFYSGQKEG